MYNLQLQSEPAHGVCVNNLCYTDLFLIAVRRRADDIIPHCD